MLIGVRPSERKASWNRCSPEAGNIRKFALIRVELNGEYALIASKGGDPEHSAWFNNLVAEPMVEIQDGPHPHDYTTEIITSDERQTWWDRGVEIYPPYAEYQDKTDRLIPVFVARRTQQPSGNIGDQPND